jgi:hypothetical protein
MNAEYQRLEAEASAVELQLRDLGMTVDLRSAANLIKCEQQLADLGRKLASLRLGLALIRAAKSSEMRKQERQFIKSLPKNYHSQGTREKKIDLPDDVTVTLLVTYYHRCQSGGDSRRWLFPMLMLLGITGRYTPQMKKRMAKTAALLGSYDEAVVMLAEEGIHIFANQLRDVTAGSGAIESAVRRAINLRVKSNAVYWLRHNAKP